MDEIVKCGQYLILNHKILSEEKTSQAELKMDQQFSKYKPTCIRIFKIYMKITIKYKHIKILLVRMMDLLGQYIYPASFSCYA